MLQMMGQIRHEASHEWAYNRCVKKKELDKKRRGKKGGKRGKPEKLKKGGILRK